MTLQIIESNLVAAPIRVLLAKVGLDGHDRGVKVVARALRDAGMDVIYTGLHRTPDEVVVAAIQEDADILGVSLLSGTQMTVFPKIFARLKEEGADDMIVVAGGVMPDEDAVALKQMGVSEVLLQDTPLDKIVAPAARTRRPTGSALTAMEAWSFPASYDESYFPAASSRYWFRRARDDGRVGARSAHCRAPATGLHLRLRARPLLPEQMGRSRVSPVAAQSLEDFESKVPVVQKKDLRAAQARVPPFGDYLCVPESEIFHIHGTSGTTGRPDRVRHRPQRLARDRQRARPGHVGRWACGPGDTIFVAAIFSASTWAAGARSAGAERLGARCFPFGAGAPACRRAARSGST